MVGGYVGIRYELFIGLTYKNHVFCIWRYATPSSWLEEHVKWGVIFHEFEINLVSGRLGWSHKTKLNWRSHNSRNAAKAWSKISKWHGYTVDLLSLQHIGVYY